MHTDYPSRAAAVFEPIACVERGGRCVRFADFTLRRVALLHSVRSPLFYADAPLGAGVGWIVTAYICAAPDASALTDAFARGGTPALTRLAGDWASDALADFEHVADCAQRLKEEYARLATLDPPDKKTGGEVVTEEGKSARRATERSPSSPGTASPRSAGAGR